MTAEQEAERRFPFMNPQEGSDDYNSLMAIKRESFIAGVQYARAKEWISVKDMKPKKDEWVLLYNGYWRGVGKRFTKSDRDEPDYCDEITEYISPDPTHWQPLPEPPPSK